MPLTSTKLQTMRDALLRARAKGAREVQVGNERVRYGSDAEMASALAFLDAEIRRGQSGTKSKIAFSSSKGV